MRSRFDPVGTIDRRVRRRNGVGAVLGVQGAPDRASVRLRNHRRDGQKADQSDDRRQHPGAEKTHPHARTIYANRWAGIEAHQKSCPKLLSSGTPLG
jgi:hypothetical protein